MQDEPKMIAEMPGGLPESLGMAEASGDMEHRDPAGRPMSTWQRLTARRSRSWVKRADVPLGVLPCGEPISWPAANERQALATLIRRREGKDCNPAGDMLLFTTADGGHAVVVDDTAG